jgi:hypothetical protein
MRGRSVILSRGRIVITAGQRQEQCLHGLTTTGTIASRPNSRTSAVHRMLLDDVLENDAANGTPRNTSVHLFDVHLGRLSRSGRSRGLGGNNSLSLGEAAMSRTKLFPCNRDVFRALFSRVLGNSLALRQLWRQGCLLLATVGGTKLLSCKAHEMTTTRSSGMTDSRTLRQRRTERRGVFFLVKLKVLMMMSIFFTLRRRRFRRRRFIVVVSIGTLWTGQRIMSGIVSRASVAVTHMMGLICMLVAEAVFIQIGRTRARHLGLCNASTGCFGRLGLHILRIECFLISNEKYQNSNL